MISILVTGGAGFVGGNFVRLALKEESDWKITVIDRFGGRETAPVLDGLREKYKDRFNLIKMDLNDKRLRAIFDEGLFDFVLHFAAKNPTGKEIGEPFNFAEINVGRSGLLLEEVRRLKSEKNIRFIHLSSYEVYGTMEKTPFTEKSPLRPTTPYAASKASTDLLCLAYHKTFGIDVILTRTTNIYGPYQSEDKLIPMIVQKSLKNEEIQIFGNGQIVRDWIFVDDHNRGVLKVLKFGKSGEIYNIGARCPKSQKEIVEEVLKNVAKFKKVKVENLRKLVKFGIKRIAEDEARMLDSSKIREELGFTPEVTFEDGIKESVLFFIKKFEIGV